MKSKEMTTKTKEQIFAEKAVNYCVCYSTVCPLREHCLRSILATYSPTLRLSVHSVNLNNPEMQRDGCPQYRNDKPVRMPVGLATIYYDMPGHKERAIKQLLISTYSRKRYYEYHNGTRPMTPDVERHIRQVIKNAGWTEEPHFLKYVEEYLW
jgi:hypothetical protein